MTVRSKKRGRAKKVKDLALSKCKHKCGRYSAKDRLECNTCRVQANRRNNPITYSYHLLKKSAKKRGIKFTITIEWFSKFIAKTDYMANKGKLFDNLTIDRINNDKGYEVGNLQVLTRSDNSIKYWQDYRDKKRKEQTDSQGNTVISYEPDQPDNMPIQAPF